MIFALRCRKVPANRKRLSYPVRNGPERFAQLSFSKGIRDVKAIASWVSPVLAGIMAFVGLLASSRAADGAFAVGGLLVFLGCVAYIFFAIGRHYDRMDAAH